MSNDTIIFITTIAALGIQTTWALILISRQRGRIQLLEKRLSAEDRWDSFDPGPLTDNALKRVLSSNHFPPSKTLDRVQDAFERLRRERDEVHHR